MALQKQKIPVDKLRTGMYVCELDRPWVETPFLMQGFIIESGEDIATLAAYCQYVYVDVAYQPGNTISLHAPSARPGGSETQPGRTGKTADILAFRGQRHYTDSVSWRREVEMARRAVEGLTDTVKQLFDTLQADGSFQYGKLKQAVVPLVSSIERNPDACIWLARLKSRSDYFYKHSVACAIWAVALGRELGLPPQDLKSLALGALLMDVGMLRLPQSILQKSDPLREAEKVQVQRHVHYSLREVEKSQLTNQDIWDMVAHHHERHDGSGYSHGLSGEQIPLFARIAGIVDCYDAMTSDRHYRQPVSPSKAIRQLYKQRDTAFEGALVEEFIQAVGLYPSGTMVLLSTGEVAVVLAEGRTRRLKPQVLLLLDNNKQPLDTSKVINLVDAEAPGLGEAIDIVHSLEPGAYGVYPENIAYKPA